MMTTKFNGIKFRGKCAGMWRKGSHIAYSNGEVIKNWNGSMSFEYTVEDHKTVGQFIGFDSKGGEIYTGDIVSYKNSNYLVRWNNENLCVEIVGLGGVHRGEIIPNAACIGHCRVIGNKFDNPEFLVVCRK